jgi:transcriptional antiterminator RfaH
MRSACQIRPNQVIIALRNLIRQGYNTFHPVFETKRLYRGKLTVVKEPLFPGYVFIELLSNQRWVPINSTSGVRRLLIWQPEDSEYLAPARIPDEFVCGLQSCCHYCEDHDDKTVWRLVPRTRVCIIAGPFAGHEGAIVNWSGADRCRLVTWLLNRDTIVEVSAGDIAAVATAARAPQA